MILLAAVIASAFSEFPEWDGEFTAFEECFGEREELAEDIAAPILWGIIAEQENRDRLLSMVGEDQQVEYTPQPELEKLLVPYAPSDSTVIDFGMGLSVFLANQVGENGEVYAFESQQEAFAERFWQLNHQVASQTRLYYVEPKKQGLLDQIPIDPACLLCIKAGGRENVVIKGAKELIQRDHPVILIHLIGGMETSQLDRYIKEELDRRIQQIEVMGYHLECIEGDLYLGLPL